MGDTKDQYTNGTIENLTSVTATLIKFHEYQEGGRVKRNYPKNIQGGYSGQFIHYNKISCADGDFAGFVYRSKNYGSRNSAGEQYDWVFAWYNSYDHQAQPNAVYTDILKPQSHPESFWDDVLEKLKQGSAKMSIRKFQCESNVSIDNALPANFTANLFTF